MFCNRILWVKTIQFIFTFFLDACIVSDRCLNNHKILIFRFRMSTDERSSEYRFLTTDKIYNTWLYNQLVPFVTKFFYILFLHKISNRMSGVISFFL